MFSVLIKIVFLISRSYPKSNMKRKQIFDQKDVLQTIFSVYANWRKTFGFFICCSLLI